MKNSSHEFLLHQKEAMEMIAKVTRSIYDILENIAQHEIEKDPIGYIREQSMLAPDGGTLVERIADEDEQAMGFEDEEDDDEKFVSVQVENVDPQRADETQQKTKKRTPSKAANLYDPELLEELEEVF